MKNKINTMLVLTLATLILSGCKSLYGRYERPDVKTTGLVRDALSDKDTLLANDTASFGNIPWRNVFTDPILQGLIQHALDNNTDLLNAALTVNMAEAQLTAAKLSFLPSFNFSPQGTISSWDGTRANKIYSLPVSASWNVDLFGTLLSSKRAAQIALLQSKDYQVAVRTKVIAGVANMYYTLLMLDKQMQLVGDMEQLTKDTWEIMKLRKDASVGVRSVAVQSAEANYYSVLVQKTDIRRQIREAENSLSLLIGQQAQAIVRGKMDDQLLPTSFSTGVGLRLLNNRADVHAAEMKLAQCFYNVQTARSRFYPALNISGSGAYTNSGGMGIINPGSMLWRAVGSLTQPIFQNGKLVAGLKVAKAQYEQAYNSWQNAILTAGSEVSNALVKYNTSLEKSKIEEKKIKVLKKNVEDTKELMASSRTTYLEVITAQSSLLNTELAKVADDFARMQAIVNLYSALGGGAK